MHRRRFLTTTSAALAAAAAPAAKPQAAEAVHLATNTYPWGTFAQRDKQIFKLHSDEALAAIASAGIQGYEPGVTRAEELAGLGARLKAHGLEMRSIYVNSTLHDEAEAARSIAEVLAIARAAGELGCKIIVTNPAPLPRGGARAKTDAQLIAQAASLDKLGAALRQLGIALAYHNHDVELRHGAREFHHMLTATDPEKVKFCLDAHWIFRGCGDSQVALFDALEHYGSRVVELHLRQSHGGVWTEVFTPQDDIDYSRLARWLEQHKLKPHLTLEQAVEGRSPHTLDAVAAHRRSAAQAQAVFAAPGSL